MAKSTAEAIHTIRTAVGQGDVQTAWSLIQPILRYPDSQDRSPDELAATWAYFQKTVKRLDFDSLETLIDESRNNPDDPALLLALGRGLLRYDLDAIAATPLTHASRIMSRTSPIADEVSDALATAMQGVQAP